MIWARFTATGPMGTDTAMTLSVHQSVIKSNITASPKIDPETQQRSQRAEQIFYTTD